MGVFRSRALRINKPAPEARLWNVLRELGSHHFRRQVQIGPYYADFLSHRAKLVIEVDGDSHFVEDGPEYDRVRSERFAEDGFRVLRFTNDEVMKNLEGVTAVIIAELTPPTLDPSPRGGGRQ